MSDIVSRIRSRPHDAPMPTEHLLDDAATEIERLSDLAYWLLRKIEVAHALCLDPKASRQSIGEVLEGTLSKPGSSRQSVV